ncbi:efflux RND transporter periplasmic adaptor subunit [Pistricoccus aurantiacus]|uniref:Efflux RND transporter periplasmic adaptor subunit n=1 Tax=Pistricoccus aurantiacus TaxID=1883414 RepID=A0A5B8SWV0_9GAMM|nr:efflux RND transporter periplasmic adaptor subunit [Pistricoccus aurantiacus]QEA40584.1 efflux RND transporter periplasmic adaptor subunit [Pistricoccus aurantiacus]
MKKVWGRGLFIALGLVVGIGLVVWFVANRQAPSRDEAVATAPTVRVIEAGLMPLAVEARGYGTARPARRWDAIANVPGRVVERHPGLESGTLLTKDTLMLEIDPSRYRLAEAEAKAELASLAAEQAQLEMEAENTGRLLALERERLRLAEQELARIRRLANSGSVSRSRLDTEERAALSQRQTVQSLENELQLIPSRRQRLEARAEQASTRLAQARQDLEDTRFVAPFDLRLGEVEAELHQYINAGQRLFSADGIEAAEVVAQVPMDMLRRLLGTQTVRDADDETLDIAQRLDFSVIEAEVSLVAGKGARWPARVVRIANGLDPATRTAQVVVRIDDPYRQVSPLTSPALVRDMYVQVRLAASSPEPVMVVPAAAVHQGEVYLVDEQQRLERRSVRVAFEQHDLAVIAEGLSIGETVIVDDLVPAINGMTIDPRRDEALTRSLRRQALGETP